MQKQSLCIYVDWGRRTKTDFIYVRSSDQVRENGGIPSSNDGLSTQLATTQCKTLQKVLKYNQNIGQCELESDQANLIRVLCTFIRSEIDYAFILCYSACSTRLKMLEQVMNCGLRTATDAFHTSIAVLYANAGVMAQRFRRQMLWLKYVARRYAHPDYYEHSIMTDISIPDRCDFLQAWTRPLIVRIKEFSDKHRIRAFPMAHWTYDRIPP